VDDRRVRFTAGDARHLLVLAALAPAAMLPERLWPRICACAAWLEHVVAPRRWRDLERRLPPELLRRARLTASSFVTESERRAFEDYLQVLRCHAPMRWKPGIEVIGLEHVHAAHERGHGVILWSSGSESSSLVTKMAFARSGLAVSHLTRPTHGFSESAFGIRFLNPLRQRAERGFLRAVVMMDDARTVGALRALRKQLSNNGIVSITVGDQSRSVTTLPLLGGRCRISTGPIQLAQSTGAALLPVFCARTAPGRFRVWFEPSISPEEADPDLVPAAARFVEMLDRYIASYPLQWPGWRSDAIEFPTAQGSRQP
jgi:lauroyl/myristoyl acyltransferase